MLVGVGGTCVGVLVFVGVAEGPVYLAVSDTLETPCTLKYNGEFVTDEVPNVTVQLYPATGFSLTQYSLDKPESTVTVRVVPLFAHDLADVGAASSFGFFIAVSHPQPEGIVPLVFIVICVVGRGVGVCATDVQRLFTQTHDDPVTAILVHISCVPFVIQFVPQYAQSLFVLHA